MGKPDLASIATAPSGADNATVGGGPHRVARTRCKIEAAMRPQEAQDRMQARAEARSDAPGDRPDESGRQGIRAVGIDPLLSSAG